MKKLEIAMQEKVFEQVDELVREQVREQVFEQVDELVPKLMQYELWRGMLVIGLFGLMKIII